jgi:hypothetical protein
MSSPKPSDLQPRGVALPPELTAAIEKAIKSVSKSDMAEIHAFFTSYVRLAQDAISGMPEPGMLQMSFIRQAGNGQAGVMPHRYQLDDLHLIEKMTCAAFDASERGDNVYVEGRTVRSGLIGQQRGLEDDTVAVFALVVDNDPDKGAGWTPTVPVSLKVQTSPGNEHDWLFFESAVDTATGKALGERLRAAVKADHATGTITQPYRVAGTVNYPSPAKQKRGRVTVPTYILDEDVQALWTPERLGAEFPAASSPHEAELPPPGGQEDGDHSMVVPADTMEVIRNGVSVEVSDPDRSRVFFNVVRVLKELGWNKQKIISQLGQYPNGIARKYHGRLEFETDRAYRKIKTTESPTTPLVVTIKAEDVQMKQKDWLWEGHLLRGALELLTGEPGFGKSQIQIHYVACATAGLPWPDGAPAIEPVNVIMVTAEDALDTDVVPRLKAAGADLKRVHMLKYIKVDNRNRQFLLAEDLANLEQCIAQIGEVGLICIDPITAYMGGKMDSHKTTEVRSQLGPLKDLAERCNVAVSAVTHPAKHAGSRAIDHFIGSQAFIAAARIGHACFEEQEVDEETGEKSSTGRYLFTHVKHSGSRKMPTLAYVIEVVVLQPEAIETTRIVWEKESVNISADQAAAITRGSEKAKGKEDDVSSELCKLIMSMIDAGKGWCKQTEIAAQAKALGYSGKELRTARKKLGLVSKKDGFDGPWLWGWEGPFRFFN